MTGVPRQFGENVANKIEATGPTNMKFKIFEKKLKALSENVSCSPPPPPPPPRHIIIELCHFPLMITHK